jgi:type IV secretion system protein VirB10
MSFFKRKNTQDKSGPAAVEGERSTPSVNNSLGAQKRLTKALITIGAVGVVGLVTYWYYSDLFHKKAEENAARKADSTKTITTAVAPLKALSFDITPQPSPVAQMPPQPAMPAMVNNGQPPPLTPQQLLEQRRLSSGVFFKVESSAGGGGAQGQGSDAAGASYAGASGTGAESDGGAGSDAFSKSLQPSRQAGAKAYMLADPSLMVTKGAVIPCNVTPALDSTLPGIVTCIQSADVWSADGKVMLLERGTKWVGEQKMGLAQGQRRMGMLWIRGETPQHVLIDVDSGTADHLGRPGIDGTVDNHFWDRFGGAILISLISDVGSFLSATQSGGSGNATAVNFPGTVNGAQSVMSDVLKSTINIPPTLTRNAGAAISIYVARDLDFRDVYTLEATK